MHLLEQEVTTAFTSYRSSFTHVPSVSLQAQCDVFSLLLEDVLGSGGCSHTFHPCNPPIDKHLLDLWFPIA
jgi:hypothetical protein